MTWPGPSELGRGVVVRAGAGIPGPWATAPIIELNDAVLSDPPSGAVVVDRLHRAWVGREPVVVAWDGPDDLLDAREVETVPAWQLDAMFLFQLERLRFLCFSNHYDARYGRPKWWWAHKAGARGAEAAGPADVLLADGRPVWIDGGPRHPLPAFDHPVVHGETVDLGGFHFVPEPVRPPDQELAADQRKAVGHTRGPARVIAPAGSGKTRTLTARLAHVLNTEGVEPEIVTALAYNERAAAELRDRLGVGRSLARTIHSIGWEILREALELLEERGVREILDQLLSVPRRADSDPIGPYIEALSMVRSRLVDPAEVEISRDDVPGFAEAFDKYRHRLYSVGQVDFGEQVYGAIEALLTDHELRARWQSRCRHLLIDEFQDLTPAFVLLLRLLASPQLSVFGVGDDDQVIYGFDGADPGFLIDFEQYFPGSAAYALVTNYRCPPSVVEAAVNLLSHNRRRIDKSIRAADSHGDEEALVIIRRPRDELAVAAADRVTDWLATGSAPVDIAMLTRVNSSLIPLKAALVESGIPTSDLVGRSALDRTVVRALFAWVRVALRPDEMGRGDLLEAIRRPGRGLSRLARDLITRPTLSMDELREIGIKLDGKRSTRWASFLSDLSGAVIVAARGDAAAVISTIVEDIGLGGSARVLDSGRGNASRSGHLDDLVAIQRAAALHDEAADFESWLRRVIATPSRPSGVRLSSIHRVKGMEWPRVVIFGADEGAMPHDLSDDLEEERRVFHVALTRAIDQVVVFADSSRPSRFLDETVEAAPVTLEPAPAIGDAARRQVVGPVLTIGDRVRVWGGISGEVIGIHDGRLTIRVGDSEQSVPASDVLDITPAERAPLEAASDGLVAELKAWRRETAQAQGVHALVVLHDKTIDEIASRLPTSEGELLEVSGIGQSKLEQYGDDILALVAETRG